MNFKLLLLLGLSALATQGAVVKSRQKRTLGVATAAVNAAAGLGTSAVGTAATAAAGALAGAAAVGRSVLVAKPLVLGLAGKYALLKYLSNKKRNEGLHIGGSAGFGFGGQANNQNAYGSGVAPTVVETVESYPTVSSDVTYESIPQVVYEQPSVVYDQQPTVVYEQQPTVVYEQQPTVVYEQQPTVVYEQQPAVQVVRQPAVQVVSQPAPQAFDSSIDSYGAPAAPLLF